ncbi:hypothetical protein SAMN05216376_102153 [Mameliella alba]|uniref:hypothetical protein n=1 Tax=Mameliella alba TaxID=561184 RepID=UPI000888BD5F|nr:hypothetical protein [Mameliella alba]OWV49697.1 hypothetical protein CDZ96_04790 [Mameliella alba]PTR41685.1 hypothetical protein LX94_00976 [Mameliella alba]GGF53602.1 hypothetical protein GCM10011319_13810 [Mameliella alba]SDC34029.1 hypothetical protein SAMN05216376_102153 [Mameliella alba]
MAEEVEQEATAKEETPGLSLSGVLADQLYVLSSSSIVLTTTFAQSSEGGPVLLPLADWRMLGHAVGEEPDQEIAFEALLPLDNIAFLLRDMSGEFREAVENLEAMTSGALNLSQIDTTRMRGWLCDVAEQVESAVASLDRMGLAND